MSENVHVATTSAMVRLTEDAVEEVMRRYTKLSSIGEIVAATKVNSFVRDSVLRAMRSNTSIDLQLKWVNNGSIDRKPAFVVQGTEFNDIEDALSCLRYILEHSKCVKTISISMGIPDPKLLEKFVDLCIEAGNVRLREFYMHRTYASRSFLVLSKLIDQNAETLKIVDKIGLAEACACEKELHLEELSMHNFDLVKNGALESDALFAETNLCIEKLGSSGSTFTHLSYTTHSGFDLSKSVTTSMLSACKVESLRLTMSKGAPISRRTIPDSPVKTLTNLELIGDLIHVSTMEDHHEIFPNLKHFNFSRQDLFTKN